MNKFFDNFERSDQKDDDDDDENRNNNIYQFIYLFTFKNKKSMVQKKQFHEESRGTGRLAPGQSIDRHRDDVHLGSIGRIA